jgi:hypothetical protein
VRRVVVAIAFAAGCGEPAPRAPAPPRAVVLTSNVLREDYAGSRACAECHAPIFSTWQGSPMRNMTRDAATAAIRAPFDGAQLHVGEDVATAYTDNGVRKICVESKTSGMHDFRVTKVVGGRYREDFVGVERGSVDEVVLPMTYVFATRSWRYKGYSVMVTERPRMSWTGRWAQECIPCHNTLPLLTMLYDELYGPNLPAYQGKMEDRVLPARLQWHARASDSDGLSDALVSEIAWLGARPPDGRALATVLPAAALAMEKRLDGNKLVELGVGCEACHNGARAHARDPNVPASMTAVSPLVEVTPPRGRDGTPAQWIDHTCARCHTVLFTRYPWTWEGGTRKDKDPGGSSISSGEGRDFQLGGCASQLACTACHDPHVEDSAEALAALATPAGNHVCTTCHPQYMAAEALARHSHHQVGGAGSACIACHMAKKNMGLDYALDRYHRIGSPDDPVRVERDRPLECALCHTNKTVDALLSSMEAWWGKRYDRAALRALYGDDLGVDTLRATLARGKPHEQAVAIAVLGQARDRAALPLLVPMLAHDYPLVRYFAQRALQTITGDPVAIDVGAPAAEVRSLAAQWLGQHR